MDLTHDDKQHDLCQAVDNLAGTNYRRKKKLKDFLNRIISGTPHTIEQIYSLYFGGEGCRLVLCALNLDQGKISSLINLDMSRNRIGSEGALKICQTLPNTCIETLTLIGNEMGNEGARHFGMFLAKSNKTLHSLDLSFNQIENEGANYLSKGIDDANNSLFQDLNLDGNMISCDINHYNNSENTSGGSDFQNIRMGGSLSKIIYAAHDDEQHDLCQAVDNLVGTNYPRKKKLKDFLNRIISGTPQTTERLYGLYFGDEGCRLALCALNLDQGKTSSLINLDMSRNRIGSEGALKICQILPNTCIETLTLVGNEMGNEGARHFGMFLAKSNKILHSLDLSFNQIENEGADYLSKGIDDANSSLFENLYLDGNMISCDNDSTNFSGSSATNVLMEGLLSNKENHNENYFVLYDDMKLCCYRDDFDRKKDTYRVFGGSKTIANVERINDSTDLSFIFQFLSTESYKDLEVVAMELAQSSL